MYAIVKTGGKQYKVTPGDQVKVEKLPGNAGEEIILSDIMALVKDEKVTCGTPLVENASLTARIVRHGKARKVVIFKYKPKKRYRVKKGHRQEFTHLEILKVSTPDGDILAPEKVKIVAVPAKAKKTETKPSTAKKPTAAKKATDKPEAKKKTSEKAAAPKKPSAKTTATKAKTSAESKSKK